MSAIIDGLKHLLLGSTIDMDSDGNVYENTEDYIDDIEPEQKSRKETVEYIKSASRRPQVEGGSNIVNFRNPYTGKKSEVLLLKPKNLEDAASVCVNVRDNKACSINLEGVDHEMAQRIADFISGAVYSVDGDIQRISDEIFIAAPASFQITSDVKNEIRKNGGSFFHWATSTV